jgi:site-specific recombinase XerD
LEAQGYRRNAVASQLQLFAHMSRWLESKGLGAEHLTRELVLEFLSARRGAVYTLWLSEKGVAPLLTHLRRVGVVPVPEPPVAVAPADRVLEEFRSYLVCERGLAAGTVAADVHMARLFMAARRHPDVGLAAVTPADVVAFVQAQCEQRSAAYVTAGRGGGATPAPRTPHHHRRAPGRAGPRRGDLLHRPDQGAGLGEVLDST